MGVTKKVGAERSPVKITKIRNQEKGVLAKGVSVESSVTPEETNKIPRLLAPAVHVAFRAPQPREAYHLAETPF